MHANSHLTDYPFLLVSGGSYQNRGCEAIVKGTMEILRHEFGPGASARVGLYQAAKLTADQNSLETEERVTSFSAPPPSGKRWSLGWWVMQANFRLNAGIYPHFKTIAQQGQSSRLALHVGGDTFSLDYGKPYRYMALNRVLQARGIPVALWGASVGPFDSDPKFGSQMFDHLRSLSAVFVRESISYNYLHAHGVSKNVHLMADPAFVMKAKEPPVAKIGFTLPEEAIGINISPLVASYRGQRRADANLQEWLAFCVELVKSAASLKRPILLIPHVGRFIPAWMTSLSCTRSARS